MSVLNLNPKDAEETNSTVQPFDTLEEEPDACEPAVTTQTEQANCAFYLASRQIEGVRVSLHSGPSWSERTIVVMVSDLFDKAADEVFALKSRLYDLYPSARLNVQVIECDTDFPPLCTYYCPRYKSLNVDSGH